MINTLVIGRKKYVVVEQYEYARLLEKAAAKKTTARKLDLAERNKFAHKLIDQWRKEK